MEREGREGREGWSECDTHVPNSDSAELIVLLNEVVDVPHVLELFGNEGDISGLVLFDELLDEFHPAFVFPRLFVEKLGEESWRGWWSKSKC